MKYFDKQVNGDLLNCVSLADKQKFISAYDQMVASLNVYEKRIIQEHPEFDISEVFKIECILDLKLSKRTFKISFSIIEKYPSISKEDANEIERSIMLIIDHVLLKPLIKS